MIDMKRQQEPNSNATNDYRDQFLVDMTHFLNCQKYNSYELLLLLPQKETSKLSGFVCVIGYRTGASYGSMVHIQRFAYSVHRNVKIQPPRV